MGKSLGVVSENGELWTYGANERGQLGDGSKTDVEIPKKVLDGIVSVTVMRDYQFGAPGDFIAMLALKSDGTVWHWGGGYSLAPKQLSSGVIAIPQLINTITTMLKPVSDVIDR